ncbi:hypothetical protein Daus18300_005585 [Diaporthe australafricana]|uniref:Xylanolytic transcriptional activator regulatory domain-containing protein n=1 Tax=Diaporthe australafricana TaxID=127596 RepID=A0ABR3X081_9PEZI
MPRRQTAHSVSTARVDQSDRLRSPAAQALVTSGLAAAAADPPGPAESREFGQLGGRSSVTQGTWHSSSNLGSIFIGGPSDNDAGVSTRSGDASGLREPTGGNAKDQEPPSGEPSSADGLKEYVISMQRSTHPIKCVMVKGRYVGQTHWLHSAVLFPNAINWFDEQERRDSPCWKIMQDCKSLAKSIELRRSPQPWTGVGGRFLPARALADRLVGNYLRTFETIYRVLHLPTFKDEYESLWTDATEVTPATTMKVQLCLALGASLHDEKFSLRKQAMQWIHEANSWLAVSEQSRFSTSGLQIMCLLQQARMITEALIGDLVWVSGGTLSRTAISMGFHIDPSMLPGMSVLRAEMRRRLWTTILELELEASVEAGVPPQLARQEFNCQLPSNLNDSELSSDSDTAPAPASSNFATDASLQIALGRSLNTRLAIANFSNQPPSSPRRYEQVLKLSSELTACCRSLASSLGSLGSAASVFQKRLCEMITQRYFLILHLPYTPLTTAEPLYHFSRKTCVDTALEILYAVFQPSLDGDPVFASLQAAVNIRPRCEELQHLVICSSGPLRSILQQCVSSIASELLAVVQDLLPGPSLSGTTMSPPAPGIFPTARSRSLRNIELHLILRASVGWMEKRILAGQTNIKDYLFFVVILAEAEALMRRFSPDESRRQKASEALAQTAAMLRGMEGSDVDFPDPSVIGREDLDAINDFWMSGYSELGYGDLVSMMSI